MGKHSGYILSATILTLSILGARLQNNAFLYAMLCVVILALILVLFDKIEQKQYPFLIFFMCLGLIYQTTLLSDYLIGTDIHYEYQFALQTYNNGYWDHTIGHSYNSAMAISVFLPMLAKSLHIPLEWAFKIVPPLFLAGIPVVTYFIFKKEFGSKVAFISSFFFISIPTVLVELSGNARQSIGELFLILCLLLVVSNVINDKRIRYPLVGIFALFAAVSHYSMGGILWCYLLGAIVLLLIGKYMLKLKPSVHIGLLSIVVVVVISLSLMFYGWAARGAALNDITSCVSFQVGRVLPGNEITTDVPETAYVPPKPTMSDAPASISDAPASIVGSGGGRGTIAWCVADPMLAFATGGDFLIVDPVSKLFRIFQYITQILIIVGFAVILWNYKRHSPEYLACLILSVIILVLTLFYPGFSTLMNATRFYNIALLFLAPAVIIGGKLILRNYKILVIVILIPYFIFTSGAVFEVTKITDFSTINIPYNHALSAIRADTATVFTDNDVRARDWIKANNAFPVYGDMGGSTLVLEVQSNMGWEVNRLLERWCVNWFVYREDRLDPIPEDCYIILRERNMEKRELTHQIGVGLRWIQSFEDAGINEFLKGRPIVYQVGKAVVYGPKEQGE